MKDISYDSAADTLKHIKRVSQLLNEAAIKSIEHNQIRFEISDQITQIFKNTANRLGW